MVPRSSVPTVSSPSPGQSADLSHALRAAASAVTAAAQAAQAAAQAAHAASVAAQLCSQACAASAVRPRLASQGSQLLPAAAIESETDSAEILPPHTEQKSSHMEEAIKSTQEEFARPAPFEPRRPKTRPAVVVTGQAFRRPAAVGVDGQLWARLALPDKSAQQEQKRLPDQAPHDATIYDAMYDIPPPLRPSDRPEINRALIVFLTLLIAFIVTLAVFLLRA